MNNWLKDRYNQAILLISLLIALIYHDSFTSSFFQDDKLLLRLSRTVPIWQPIANFPYRPVSINLFYSLTQMISSHNSLGFHLILFSFFVATLFVLFKIALELLKDKGKALAVVYFYGLNISLFAYFYWIATSYFVIGDFFAFISIYFFLRKGTVNFVLTIITMVLALGSNELFFVLPIIYLAISYYRSKWPKSLVPTAVISNLLLIARVIFVGIPTATDYSLKFDFTALTTLRWYFLRSLNLPEGVNRETSLAFFLIFGVFLISLAYHFVQYLQQGKFNGKLFILAIFWFLFAALPFYFLPKHMSSYYLGLASFAPALVLSEVIWVRSKVTILVFFTYLLLTILGLSFLSGTHWIILKNTGPIGQFNSF